MVGSTAESSLLLAATLCQVTREEYQKYSVRTQGASYNTTPMARFGEALSRKYGPAGDWDPALAKTLGLHAHIYLSIAEQHLGGLQALLNHSQSGLPIGPAARSVAESSGRALWLLDNRMTLDGPDARRRVARLLLDDEENTRIHKSISYAFAHPDRAKSAEMARRAKDRVRKPGLFWPSEIEINASNGDVKLCGEVLPGPSLFVQLAGEMRGDDPKETAGYYAYMSAMTHPTAFAFIESLADASIFTGDVVVIPWRNDQEFALKIVSNATRAFYNAWCAWIAWTDTGMIEAEIVRAAHRRANGYED